MMQKLHPDNVIVNGRGNGVVGVHLVNQAHSSLPVIDRDGPVTLIRRYCNRGAGIGYPA